MLQRAASMTDKSSMERRRHLARSAKPVVAPCRHCSRPQIVAVTRVEVTDGVAWHRCRSCEHLSPLRWEDAVALGLVASTDVQPD